MMTAEQIHCYDEWRNATLRYASSFVEDKSTPKEKAEWARIVYSVMETQLAELKKVYASEEYWEYVERSERN